jgi:hypothetical protein
MWMRLLLTGVLALGYAFAQRGGGMGGEGGEGGGFGGGGLNIPRAPQVMMNRIDILAQELALDKEQKKNVKSILDQAQKEANPVHQEIVKSRLALGEAIQAGKSADEIKQLVNSEAALETQMVGIELSAFTKIYQGLQPDQRNKTRPLFTMMKGIFDNKNWNNM